MLASKAQEGQRDAILPVHMGGGGVVTFSLLISEDFVFFFDGRVFIKGPRAETLIFVTGTSGNILSPGRKTKVSGVYPESHEK